MTPRRRHRTPSVLAAWAGASVLGAFSVGCGLILGVDYEDASIDRRGPLASDGGGSGGACAPRSCQSDDCGLLEDGCGGSIVCGGCPDGSECRAGRCRCDGKTCLQLGAACGSFESGCGNRSLECGGCTGSQEACSSGQCACQPRSCPDGGADAIPCGTAPSGCGEEYVCGIAAGDCPYLGEVDAGVQTVCGGGGQNLCGPTPCQRVECQPGECGQKSNGCDDVLDCGGCDAGVCGANGVANRCGCEKARCDRLGLFCGTVSDGCGGTLDCGTCEAPEICTADGRCECTKSDPVQACAGKSCGVVPDGCRSFHQCGPPCSGGAP